MSSGDAQRVVDFVRRRAGSDEYGTWYRDLLVEMLAVDTSIQADVTRLAAGEHKVFDIIERELKAVGVQAARIPINCRITRHPYYSIPYYTARDGGRPLPCEQTYAGRANLVAILPADGPGDRGRDALYNAHIDTVAPYFGPRVAGPLVYGRGSADDKGQVALLLGQIRLIEEAKRRFGLTFAGERVYQFVIEEEMGGNGSLSLVAEERFKGYEAIIHEITGNVPHPANRGAVWYQCTLSSAGVPNARPSEMWPFVVRGLEIEGAKIQAESQHPLFKPEHVQTNHGVLGPYGKHPSAVNDHVAFVLTVRGAANAERLAMRATEIIGAAVREYTQRYGDKTREIDPETGKPKVERHYKLQVVSDAAGPALRLDVYGKTGHMGAVAQCDGAITKAAVILLALVQIGKSFPQIEATGRLADAPSPLDPLLLEGGQGFVPTHTLEQITERMRQAAAQGVRDYCRFCNVPFQPEMVETRFDKLHNDAFACDVNSPGMQSFQWAYEAMGMTWPEVTGWRVSCDARIFAKAGHNVVTFGPGTLKEAHSDNEHLDLRQVQEALAISTLQALRLGGAI